MRWTETIWTASHLSWIETRKTEREREREGERAREREREGERARERALD